MANDF